MLSHMAPHRALSLLRSRRTRITVAIALTPCTLHRLHVFLLLLLRHLRDGSADRLLLWCEQLIPEICTNDAVRTAALGRCYCVMLAPVRGAHRELDLIQITHCSFLLDMTEGGVSIGGHPGPDTPPS